MTVDDIDGRSGRTYQGIHTSTRIAVKKSIRAKTTPLPGYRANALRQLLQGLGQAWPFDADLISSKGVAPTVVGNAFIDAGQAKYGGASLSVLGAVSNLLSSNVATGTDTLGNTTGWTAQAGNQGYNSTTGVGATLSSSTAQAWQGSRSLLVQGIAGDGIFGCAATQVAVSPNTQYTFSVYVRASGSACSVSLNVYNQPGGGLSNLSGLSAVGITTTAWTRMTCGFTTNSATTSVQINLTESTNGATFFADGFLLSIGGTLLAWQDGSTLPALEYDASLMTGWAELTLAAWVRGPTTALGYLAYIDGGNPAANALSLRVESGTYKAAVTGPGGASALASYAQGVDANWHHVALTLAAKPAQALALYVDGTLRQTVALSDMPAPAAMTRLQVGHALGANPLGTNLDDLVILPWPMAAADVAGLVAMGRSAATLPTLLASGDILGNMPLAMLGTLDQVDVSANRAGGAWASDAREVAFILEEA